MPPRIVLKEFATAELARGQEVRRLRGRTGSAACQPANSLSVYAGAIALGTSTDIALPSPVTVCGNPRVLPAISHNPTASLQLAQSTLSAIAASGAAATLGPELIAANASGFTYGADSNGPTATGSGQYFEPRMPSGQSAYFGVYIGQRGTYFKYVCGSTGLQWNTTDYNAAQWNSVHAEPGAAGAGAVYMMAGPGRDPAYNGTSTQAVQWGIQQAQDAIKGAQAAGALGFDYIFMDIENVVQNGWNAVWNGCGTTKKANSVATVLDNSTFNGFRDWVWTNSSYFVGVYDAGGGGSNSWSSVFGSTTNSKVPEWTYVNETTSLSAFPSGWAVGSTTPVFFGGATTSSPCALLWQWSGGNGQLNGYGDFDQLDLNNRYSSTCHP